MYSKQELREKIIQKAWEDENFKKQLLADPKTAVKEAFGIEIPDGINLEVVEESKDKYYLVLPQSPAEAKVTNQVLGVMWP